MAAPAAVHDTGRRQARQSGPAGRAQAAVARKPAADGQKRFDRMAVQAKVAVSEPGDSDEQEADRVADQVVARMSGASGLGPPAIAPLSAHVAQRKCAACEAEDRERQAREGVPSGPAEVVQRKCAACEAEERQRMQRKGDAGPVTAHRVNVSPGGGEPIADSTRRPMEGAFGHSFEDVRVHTDAADTRALSARAYTVGNHIVFAPGEYQPGTPQGDLLLAHELTHVVQQRGGTTTAQPKCSACAGGAGPQPDRGVRVQRDIWDDLPSPPSLDDIVDAGSRAVEAGVGLASDIGHGIAAGAEAAGERIAAGAEAVAEGVASAASAGADLVGGIAGEIWDMATAYAAALGGGSISVSGTSLVISVPGPVPVCPTFAVQFQLPGLSKSVPILFGAVPIAEVLFAYGEVAAFASLTPELSGQLGPCALSGVRIVIDPTGPSFSASGALTATAALGLGAALDVGLSGEVGLMIVWPDPPFVLQIPVVGLQGGLEGFARGIVAARLSVAGAMRYSGGVFALAASERQTLGLAADLGVAGFGELQLLGQNLCRLYWPLWQWHGDTAINSGFDVSLGIGRGGAAASLTLFPPTLDPFGFEDLGIMIPRQLFADDCPLCGLLYRAGLMPSQLGGGWGPGSPGIPHPGPLLVYPNDPRIASGAKCRGACGPDCRTCDPPADPTTHERKVCVEEEGPLGKSHRFWIYPNFHHCNTHEGCRQHDACYDWSAGFGERGPLGILGPVHRLCDLEAICNYGMPQAVGWIFGKPPYDGGMEFSDAPNQTGACPGPCPDERISDETTRQRICLPELVIFNQYTPLDKRIGDSTDWIKLFEVPVDLPYLPPVLLGLFARGLFDADVSARIGPLTLRNVCLDIDPVNGDHRGTAELHLWSDIEGGLALTGQLKGSAGWGCLGGVIDTTVLSGLLGLTASARARLSGELDDQVEVACQEGKIVLTNLLVLTPCLDLLFALDAALRLELFQQFELFHRHWHLRDWRWRDCWPIELSATSTPLGDWDFHLGPEALDIVKMLRDLLGDGNSDTPGVGASPTLPRDPARAAGQRNPCGSDVRPDDECGGSALPYTQITFTAGSRGQGMVVRAAPLSKCTRTPGSQPDQSIYGSQFACMRGIETPPGSGKTESRFWVRAHLLHGETSGSGGRDLHGPGDKMWNLIISDKSFNGNMRTGPERFALDRVHDPAHPQVLWYETRVTHFPPPMDFYGQNVNVTVGEWNTASNSPGGVLRSFGPYPTRRTPPPCP